MLRVQGLVTVQDLGREGHRAIGVPPGGAMDRGALRLGNALVGNPPEAAALEIGMGEVTVSAGGSQVVAITGGDGPLHLNGTPVPPATAIKVAAGDVLRVGPTGAARFRYLAVAGGIAVARVLESRATSLAAGWGGFEGRRLEAGDDLPVGPPDRPAPLEYPGLPDRGADGPIRITGGPQAHLFPDRAAELLTTATYQVLGTSDRMGTRLTGPPLPVRGTASLPSESTAVGALQVPDDGQPIVLLRDGPTVGGYPKIAAVITADIDRFGQLGPGAPVRFEWVSIAAAVALARSDPNRTLTGW